MWQIEHIRIALAEVTVSLLRAWQCSIAGFGESGHARRYAIRFRAGPLEAVRFAAGELSGTPFEEFFVRACDPATALAALAAHQPLPRHYLTVLEDQPDLREACKRASYRLDDTETLMACELATSQLPGVDVDVAQVQTAAQADWHNATDPQGIRWVLAENLADPRMGHYAVENTIGQENNARTDQTMDDTRLKRLKRSFRFDIAFDPQS